VCVNDACCPSFSETALWEKWTEIDVAETTSPGSGETIFTGFDACLQAALLSYMATAGEAIEIEEPQVEVDPSLVYEAGEVYEAAATRCWSKTIKVGKSRLGVDIWWMKLTFEWCGYPSTNRLTKNKVRQQPKGGYGWSYRSIADESQGGGAPGFWWEKYRQWKFCFVGSDSYFCAYPWTEAEVNADGEFLHARKSCAC
jgi:hypothetical protein